MEPGHPPRQDPPTEPSHDQVNGSPPRPGSRRGWMSDSPLDGGSGWPTSAYAIVPRQAAPQSEQSPQNPVADATQYTTQPIRHETFEDAEVVPAAAPHRRRIAALIIGLIVLLVAVVGGVLATRGTGGGTEQPDGEQRAVTGPAVAGTTARVTTGTTATTGASGGPSLDASGSPVPGLSGTPDPSAVVTGSVPAGTVTDVLRAGTVRLTVLAGQPDEAFDVDGGVKQPAGADIAAGALGLSAVGGAAFAPVLAAPTLAACSAVPAAQWTDKILLTALLPTAKVCVRTGEQRFGWFSPRPGDAVITGQLYTTYLDFTVWKKSGD
ncbi:hypothetical protein ACFPIJ_18405 [Dactylosporangium cerinum]|uniref:Uncharacterized protein n=1 Tax=Dactylosporangium cerinum TaxID=1434730 RepID=A0ABV9VTY2_9ACTN